MEEKISYVTEDGLGKVERSCQSFLSELVDVLMRYDQSELVFSRFGQNALYGFGDIVLEFVDIKEIRCSVFRINFCSFECCNFYLHCYHSSYKFARFFSYKTFGKIYQNNFFFIHSIKEIE